MLVKHVLEIRTCQYRTRIVSRASPRIECAALKLGDVEWFARISIEVVLSVSSDHREPLARVGAVEALGVGILEFYD